MHMCLKCWICHAKPKMKSHHNEIENLEITRHRTQNKTITPEIHCTLYDLCFLLELLLLFDNVQKSHNKSHVLWRKAICVTSNTAYCWPYTCSKNNVMLFTSPFYDSTVNTKCYGSTAFIEYVSFNVEQLHSSPATTLKWSVRMFDPASVFWFGCCPPAYTL